MHAFDLVYNLIKIKWQLRLILEYEINLRTENTIYS